MRAQFIAIAAALSLMFGAVSCVTINEQLGDNFIPTDQLWQVYPCEAQPLTEITMERSNSLSGYSTSRFTFGSVNDERFQSVKSTSFTLVPFAKDIDFGEDWEVMQFHFSAARDTFSVLYDYQKRMLQNVRVYELNQVLDSTILYTGAFSEEDVLTKFVNTDYAITAGTPIYNGGDSLSFDFSSAYAEKVINGIIEWQKMEKERRDSLDNYLKHVPGIYICSDPQTERGGRINMFDLPIRASDGYIDGNYAELKINTRYKNREERTDTSFLFYFGPSEFLKDDATSYPAQYAFNASTNTAASDFMSTWDRTEIYIEGGSGYKPVVKAAQIKEIVNNLIEEKSAEIDAGKVVINKATINLPYNVNGDWSKLDKYPLILSPTVKLMSDDKKYVSYAGLTDSSIESENHGNINRSLSKYSPDISHHVQEIVKLTQGKGEDVDPNETDEQFAERIAKYDIWFLIMHEEITESNSPGSAYDDYYDNLLYNSYYNNMMYDPYGYGYGYGGYGGYGYGGYGYGGYGYNNYYNYMMMAQYASASSQPTTSSSIELDRDRFYNAILNGPESSGERPSLKITFSAPLKEEE